MHVRLLAVLALIVSFSALANGRAPAVEDFVGIEVDHVESTPRGSESLFNLESDMQAIKQQEIKQLVPPTKTKEFAWDPITVSTVAVLFFLPLIACLVTMRKLRRKATIESASNIEVLEKYRKEREARKNQEQKKAS